LAIQEKKDRIKIKNEAVLKTYTEQLVKDFKNIKRLTQLKLGKTMKQVYRLVTNTINQVQRMGAQTKRNKPQKEKTVKIGKKAPTKENKTNARNNKIIITLWTTVLKKGFQPKTQEEVNKAAKTVTAKSSYK
jgi:hypothetical protein